MKALERNISRHSNGTLYFVARRGGKLKLRSLRTKNLAVARRRLLQLGEASVIQGRAKELAREAKRRSSLTGAKAPGSLPLQISPESISTVVDTVVDSVVDSEVPSDSPNRVTRSQVGERFFKETLEEFDKVLRPVLLSPGALAMASRGRRAVESYVESSASKLSKPKPFTWETFSPILVWQAYRDSGLPRYGRQLTTGANHLKWYLGRLCAWAAQVGHISPTRVAEISGQLKQVPRIKISPRRVRIAEFSKVEEYFHQLACELGDSPSGKLSLDFAKFLSCTGLRKSSALGLTWRSVDFNSRSIEVLQKGGSRIVIPLTPQAFEILESRFQRDKSGGPFLAMEAKDLHRLGRRMKKVSLALDMDFETLHCFRHYFASRALMSGLSVAEVATLLGHRDGGVLVLQTYGHICGSRLRSALSELRC